MNDPIVFPAHRATCIFCDRFDKKLGGGTQEFFILCPHLSRVGQILDLSGNFVLIPDIAPLSRDHLLLVTQSHHNSFASLPKSIVPEAETMVESILRRMQSFHPDSELFAFEHGTGKIGDQVVQCGACNSTDHAHLHLLPLPTPRPGGTACLLAGELKTLGLRLETILPLPSLHLQDVVRGNPYLFLWSSRDDKGYVLVQDTISCVIPSQIIRKLLAIWSLGLHEYQTELWDWRNLYVLFPRQVKASITDTIERWLLDPAQESSHGLQHS